MTRLKYMKFYEDRGLEISKAEGQYVWDPEGNIYLDFHTGHGVAFLGHRNPKIVEAIVSQIENVATATPSFKVKIREDMLASLESIIPAHLSHVTLLNSGSEAVELALKIARKTTRKKKLIGFSGSFHGRTMGALSVTGSPKYRSSFEPLVGDSIILPYNNVEALDKIDSETAGIIVELIQGEGGVIPAERDFIKALKEKAEEKDAILIVDEVQTGFGRTGSIWAFQHYNVEPDILVAGKALGGGFPVSLVALPEDLASKLEPGDHGSTYGGNPLACAAVKASVEVLVGDNVAGRAEFMGKLLHDKLVSKLRDNRLVKGIRGLGLMIGVDLRIVPGRVIKCIQSRRVLTLKAGSTVVRLLPPYLITENDVEWGVEAIARCAYEEPSLKTPS